MTQNVFSFFLSFIFCLNAYAIDSPLVQGLAGAGRSGIPREGAFTNPASLAFLNSSSSFLIFTKPKIQDFNAGGRAVSIGAYDGENQIVKGALSYSDVSRARTVGGVQAYEDRSEIRFAAGRMITAGVAGGLNARYVTRRNNGQETKFLQSDLGVIFPLFSDVRAGLTYENLFEKDQEIPPTAAVGLQSSLGNGIQVYADGTRILKGPLKGKKSWALGAEFSIVSDFILRGGRFQDGYLGKKGWAMGVTWAGPRASFDYAMRKTSEAHPEKDHIFGMSVAF